MKINPKNVKLKNDRLIELRSAAPADAENILKHLRITHHESYRNLNQPGSYWDIFKTSDEEKILADFENSQSKFMMVAVFENRIVGGLGFWNYPAEFVKRSASLGMSIQKEFSQCGLGTEMINLMLEQAKQMGIHRVDLTVRTYNEAGIKLYEKAGFERIGLLKEIAFIDGQYVDEYSYQKILK